MLQNIVKDKRAKIILACATVLVVAVGIIFVMLSQVNAPEQPRDAIPELPSECLIIKENKLTGIENMPSGQYRVIIPDNVVKIGSRAFEGDEGLVSVKFNTAMQEVSAYAFSDCVNLKEVDMSDAYMMRSLGGYAFSGCTSLESIIFPYEIPLLGGYAFKDCTSLTELEFNSKIGSLGEGIFLNCTGLQSVRFSEGQKDVYGKMFEGCISLKNIYLPETLEIINYGAFKNCVSLESIDLPENLKIIAGDAFDGWLARKSIDIPESIDAIYEAFDGCDLLSETENGISYVDSWAVSIAEETENVVFREGTVGIARSMKCPNVKTVYIPASVTHFADTFRESETLLEVVFADNSCLEKLYSYAFYNCTALEKVDFGKNSSLTALGWLGFKGCISLKSIVIPASVKELGNSFEGCTALEKIEFREDSKTTLLGTEAFKGLSALKELIIPEGVESILDGCFKDCVSLERVVIPSTVTAIGKSVFEGCESLISVEVMDTGGWCLYDAESEEKVNEIPPDALNVPEDTAKWFKRYSEKQQTMKKEA